MSIYTSCRKLLKDFTFHHLCEALEIQMHPDDERDLRAEMGIINTKPFYVSGDDPHNDVWITSQGVYVKGWVTAVRGNLQHAIMITHQPQVNAAPTSAPVIAYNVYNEVIDAIQYFVGKYGGFPLTVVLGNKDYGGLLQSSTIVGTSSGTVYVQGIKCLSDRYATDGFVLCADNSSASTYKMGSRLANSVNIGNVGPVQAPTFGMIQTNYSPPVPSNGAFLDAARYLFPHDTGAVAKCECGSTAVGSKRHSSWCPQHSDE